MSNMPNSKRHSKPELENTGKIQPDTILRVDMSGDVAGYLLQRLAIIKDLEMGADGGEQNVLNAHRCTEIAVAIADALSLYTKQNEVERLGKTPAFKRLFLAMTDDKQMN